MRRPFCPAAGPEPGLPAPESRTRSSAEFRLSPRRDLSTIVRPVLSASLLLVALVNGCARPADKSAGDTDDALPALEVKVATAELVTAPRHQPLPATIRPLARATIAAKVTGSIASTGLAVGKAVKAGDVLVTLRADELTARVEQARAAQRQAEREYERETTLEKSGASTSDAVSTADDRRQQARAQSQEAEAMLTYTRIAAPFAGVITAEWVKPGDLATPGRPLFELEATSQLRAELHVPESLPLPALGTALTVIADREPCTGQLVELSPAADPASRTRMAKVELGDDAPVRSGQFVRVLWPAGSETRLTIPASALSMLGQMERVFVVEDSRAHLRLVRSSARAGDSVEIAAGLAAGEAVVMAPPENLRDGRRVEIRP